MYMYLGFNLVQFTKHMESWDFTVKMTSAWLYNKSI